MILTSSACSATPPAALTPPANLSAPCAPLPEFDGQTSDDLAQSYLDLVAIYNDCAIRHNGLSRAVP